METSNQNTATSNEQPVTSNENPRLTDAVGQAVSGIQQPVPIAIGTIDEKPQVPSITDHIITAMCEFYQPEGEPETLELKTTMDLIDEMAAIADIEKWIVTLALETAGFKLKYTDAGVFWMLYKI